MNLEISEIESIAALKDSFGYKLLLDRIKAEIDTIQQEICEPGTPVNTEMILYWRALNSVYKVLYSYPEQMQKEFNEIKKSVNNFEPQENIPKEFLDKLLKEYEIRKLGK